MSENNKLQAEIPFVVSQIQMAFSNFLAAFDAERRGDGGEGQDEHGHGHHGGGKPPTTTVITSNGGGAEATVSFAENGAMPVTTVVGTADARETLTYSISGGADAAKFTINPTTGVLSFVTAPDAEAPIDVGSNNVYDVIVKVSDGTTSDTQAIAVTVTNVNDNAPIIGSNGGGAAAAVVVAENTTVVTTVIAADADAGTTLVYSIAGGADAAKFAINSTTGVLSLVTAPDFEAPTDVGGNNVYDVIVKVSDGTTSDTQAIAVTVTNVNDNAPVIGSNGGGTAAAVSVAENSTAVTTVGATDADAGTTLVYSIAGGADATKFAIDSTTGALNFVAAPDFEAPTDAGGNNVYDVTVRASDGTLSSTQDIAVMVTNVNDNAPVIVSNGGDAGVTVFVAENTTAVTTVSGTDADAGTTLVYSIAGGVDAAKFEIDSNTGALSFATPPDFENPTDAPSIMGNDNAYDVIVKVSDGTRSDTQALYVRVMNVNDNVPVINSNGAGATAAVSMEEDYLSVTTVSATDADAGSTLTYSIVGGADAAKFAIDPMTGELNFVTTPDFEVPTDVGGDNVYDVTVQASDGALASTQAIAVAVTNSNDNVPVIVSNGGGSAAAVDVAENSTAVTTVSATDADAGTTLVYSIAAGADAAKFAIDSITGVLSFVSAPDFETPASVHGNNVYLVTVQANDGAFVTTQDIAVTVTNVNDNAPVIFSNGGGDVAAVSMVENSTAVTTVSAIDAEVGVHVEYSIVGGADAARFAIDSTTGALSFVAAPDFEAPADVDGNNVYDVTVQASDGTLTDTQTIGVAVTNVNDNTPVIVSNGGGAIAAVSVTENSTAVATVTATDADPGTTLVYSIAGGADDTKFAINAATGELRFVTAPNFEAPTDYGGNNVYDVLVMANDGARIDTQAIAVTVTNVNDNTPVITSNGGGASASVSISENSNAVTAVSAIDADPGTTLTYGIAGGADASKFTINSTTGALSFISAPDFEAPTDVGANNVYDIVVSASDGVNIDTQAVAITVTDVVETPDTSPPIVGITFFTEVGSSTISVGFNEPVTATSLAGWTVTLNPVNGDGGTPVAITGFSGMGTSTIVLNTAITLLSTDVIKIHYDASAGNLTDLAGNRAGSADLYVGGTGNNVIDLSNHTSDITQMLRGNAGADVIVGTSKDDILFDGSGTDTLVGGRGADLIHLGENGISDSNGNLLYSRDVVKVGLGDSTTNAFDQILGNLTNPAGSGFDIASANVANHDVLNLQSQVIAANVTNSVDNGAINVGVIKNHSISNGIVTFYDADTAGNAITINTANAQTAVNYLAANITRPGATVAFQMDTNGVPGADSLMVFQDNGVGVSGVAAADTAVLMVDLVNVGSATLGTTAGANVVQLQDTTGPVALSMNTNASGVHMAFSEGVIAPVDTSSITLFQNGTTAMGPVTVAGNGTAVMDVLSGTALAPSDWVLMHYQPTSSSNAFTDVQGNLFGTSANGLNLAVGNAQSNSINLSGLSLTTGATLLGNNGNDVLVGSSLNDVLVGGGGADTMTGGAGTDSFVINQGDSPGLTLISVGSNGILDNGDTFTLNNGFDRITDFSSGEVLTLLSPNLTNLQNPTFIGPDTYPLGVPFDNGFYVIQGNVTGTGFTVNTTTGTDTLIVFDGLATGFGMSTVALSGVTVAQLDISSGSNVITHKGSTAPIVDTTAPSNLSASFNETGTPVISLGFDEAVTLSSAAGLTLSKNPVSGLGGTAMSITGIGGSGSNTLTLEANTSSTLLATDIVKVQYDASVGALTDLSGNEISSQEIYAGGSGDNVINLSSYSGTFRQTLRGNSGNDTLTGTQNNDSLIDGAGSDILTGGKGADTIVLAESLSSGTQYRDIVKIGMGDSTSNAADTIQGSRTNLLGSGFDITSATVANHDVLNLQSQVIAADVIHANGTDVGAITQHSISNGIVTFEDVGGAAILINSSNWSDALNYLKTNITTAGTTVAYKVDRDNSGSVDTLFVFQDNGKLASGVDVADTVVTMTDLNGIDSATLGTTAGANVVQLQDTTGPRTVDFVPTADGVHLLFTESTFLGTVTQSELLKNGSVTMIRTSVDNDGSADITVHTDQTLAATDWVLQKFNATNLTNGAHDALGNTNVSPVGGVNLVRGGDGDNTINLSGLTAFASVNGNAGNDTIIGSSFSDTLQGGAGADTMTGGAGTDSYIFYQGESPTGVVNLNAGGTSGVLDNGDTFTFANGVDRITDFASGETLNMLAPENSNLPFPSWMGAAPTNGLATDSGFFMVQGNYNGTTTFTVNNTAGTDSLVVYDGDSSAGVSQSAIVLSGVTLAQLTALTGNHFVGHI